MPLKLMYITNKPKIAQIAQQSGVERIFVDMEYIGKDERQAGLDTVKSHHTFSDIENIKNAISGGESELLVRVNPMHNATKDYSSSEEEISTAIDCGADIIMLPQFRSPREVEHFLKIVDKRAKTILLLETKEAAENIEDILSISGFDEIHIGINDLHLDLKKKFMFELYIDGTLSGLAGVLRERNIFFGIGGIARIGYGLLPAEYVIAEQYSLGSKMAILSRSFCDSNNATDMGALEILFKEEINNIRNYEKKVELFSCEEYEKNRILMKEKILDIVESIKKREK